MMNESDWYQNIIRPSWAPPAWIFGPVWTFLYFLIFISYGKVFLMTLKKEIPFSVAIPFILNLIFNFSFSPIQFGLQNLPLASINILLVLGTLIWSMIAIYKYKKWICYIQIPYLLWVSFATVLQLTVTFLNF
jgi:tryptophan-rich sensory protein